MDTTTRPVQAPPVQAKTMPVAVPQNARAWKAAQDFEAMALGELLKPMFDTVDLSRTPFGGGPGEEAWKPMLVTEMAKKLAAAGGLGLAGPIYQQILRMQEDADAPRMIAKAPKAGAARHEADPTTRRKPTP